MPRSNEGKIGTMSGLTILGYALVALGVLGGLGGAVTRPEHAWTYALGGLIALSAGLALVQGLPNWAPIAAIWITAVVACVYLATLHWQWWLFACAAVVVVAVGAIFTWLITRAGN